MTPRQLALINYHRDIGSFSATPERPAIFVLDIEDSRARLMAEAGGRPPEELDSHLTRCREKGALPSVVAGLPMENANFILAANGLRILPAPPERFFYMVVVSDGGTVVALVPNDFAAG